VVLGGAAAGWVLRYGVDQAPAAGTLLLALALAVHHQAAGLAAALPVTARVARAVPVRFARHGTVVLVLSAAIAALTLGLSRPAGSSSLELLGVAAVVVVVSVPVLLSRSGPR
jgi:zinc transporter ZupT